LNVSRGKSKNPLFLAFIEAGTQAGYPYTDDMNGFQQEGIGWSDMTIHKGKRWSAAVHASLNDPVNFLQHQANAGRLVYPFSLGRLHFLFQIALKVVVYRRHEWIPARRNRLE
jgi:choline dehydrogenase-like flavoprotein